MSINLKLSSTVTLSLREYFILYYCSVKLALHVYYTPHEVL
uniref:Uncharacterized protein n=1 Tax=Arundo donax TaxID=35708 RepID=A0A0A9FWP1_ARUDO